jgi:putative glycosyltransferase (TIGR04372 family)
MKNFVKNIKYFGVYLLAPLIFLFVKTISLLTALRIGFLHSDRIGHLSVNTELFLRQQTLKKNSKSRPYIFFLLNDYIANNQLLNMIKRRLFVIENKFLTKFMRIIYIFFPKSTLWVELPIDSDKPYEFSRISPQLAFTPEEEKKGLDLLKKIGIPRGAEFICFHARDKAYLDTLHTFRSRQEWSYHDFRDCDINNYLPAVKYLAEQKIYALRMGAVVEKDIPADNPYIIDYAKNFRTDFGDIYLPAKCKFFLGNTSGIRLISHIFNTPAIIANCAPLNDMSPLNDIVFSHRDILLPKKYWSHGLKRFLTWREVIKQGMDSWFNTKYYLDAGIEVIENSVDEILALTKEMHSRLDGTWVPADEDKELQQRFRDLFPPGHYSYNFHVRIGAEFLRQNKELLS